MPYNPNSGYGLAESIRLHMNLPVLGKILLVCPSADANFGRLANLVKTDPDGVVRLYTTIAAAYADATTNANDVIALSGNATHLITPFEITKSRLHFIGLDGGDHLVAPGAKIGNATGDTAAYVIKNLGVRNSFRNIRLLQNSTEATALTVFQDGGEGTVCKNFEAMFGVVNNLDQTDAYEFVAGTDSGTFIDCKFGADTLLTSAARTVMLIDQVTSSQEFKSNIFRRCTFMISSSEAGAQFIKMAASGDILFSNHFEDCSLIASIDSAGGIALTRAVSTANGTTKGALFFSYPRVHGVTDFGTNGTNNDQLYVASPLMSNTDIVSVLPVAT